MKQMILVVIAIGMVGMLSAQEREQQVFERNEIRLNMLEMLARSTVNVSYERFLSPQTSIGATTMIALNDDYYEHFEFAPSFRIYFNDDLLELRKSVFIELFTALVVAEDSYYYDYVACDYPAQAISASTDTQGLSIAPCGYANYSQEPEAEFAIGMMLGKKWVNQSNFTFELGVGFGRYLTQNDNDAYPRLNLSVGKRF